MFNNPAVLDLNANLVEVTRIIERQSLALRREAVNALNHPGFCTGANYGYGNLAGSPDARFNMNSTSFGHIGYTSAPAREELFGAHYRF
jgi:hypothetical protein